MIKDFTVNEVVNCTLAIVEAQIKEASNGDYLHMVLTDGEQNIDAKIWKYNKGNGVPFSGMVVDLTALVGEYKGKKDLNVKTIKQNTTVPVERFMGYDEEKSMNNLNQLLTKIDTKGNSLCKITNYILKVYMDRLSKAVGAKSVHHNKIGGLIQHMLEVTEAAEKLGEIASNTMSCEIDTNLLICGAILHDIGKLDSYTVEGLKIDESTPGMLIDHMALSILIIDRAYTELDLKKDMEYYKLLHIIQSHHGCKEWGSPVEPKFIEAQIIHFADNFSAKVEIMRNELNKCDNDWTDKCWSLGGIRLFKG